MPDGQEIQAQTPDGVIHSFPAGTPDDVVDKVVKNHINTVSVGGNPVNLKTGEGGAGPSAPPVPKELKSAITSSNLSDEYNRQQKQPSPLESATHDIGAGNYAKGAHTIVSNFGKAAAPLALPALVGAPLATIGALGGGALGSYGGSKLADYFGASPDVANVAGDVGGLAGGMAGGFTGGATRIPFLRGAARSALLDPATGEPTITPTSILKRALRTPEETQGILATKKGPNVPITESPNYPKIAAARGAALKGARAEIPSGQYESITKSPYATQNAAAQAFERGEPGPFNRLSESPNKSPAEVASPAPVDEVAQAVKEKRASWIPTRMPKAATAEVAGPFGNVERPEMQAGIPRVGAPTPAQGLAERQAAIAPTGKGIALPGSPPPDFKATLVSYERPNLVKMVKDPNTPYANRVAAIRELRRNPGEVPKEVLDNLTRYMVEPGAKIKIYGGPTK